MAIENFDELMKMAEERAKKRFHNFMMRNTDGDMRALVWLIDDARYEDDRTEFAWQVWQAASLSITQV